MQSTLRARLIVSLLRGVVFSYAVTICIIGPLVIKLSGDSLYGYPLIALIIVFVSIPFGLGAFVTTVIFANIAIKHYVIFSILLGCAIIAVFAAFLLSLGRNNKFPDTLLQENNLQSLTIAFSLILTSVVGTITNYKPNKIVTPRINL